MKNNPIKKIEKAFDIAIKHLADKRVMAGHAETAKNIIYDRTKEGFGIFGESANERQRQKLKALSTHYIVTKRIGAKLGKFGAVKRSNLTFTGQMLDAITFKVKNNGFEVFIKKTKRRGKGEKLTNYQLSQIVTQEGRPFMGLTKGELRVILKELEKQLTKKVTAILK